jgi:aminopeptidase N
LQNPEEVLTGTQRQRLEQAEQSPKPLFIVTPGEAKANASRKASRSADKKTWTFKAENVRDFAFASSRRFIWDAMGAPGHLHAGRPVLAMSFYPPEAEPLWSRYSTPATIHALDVFSRATFDYPWPVVQSVQAYKISMEYPMLAFTEYRPEKDGTYDQETKSSLISVIFHEVGHNYFPMIVNSDERQWTWMDEGLTTFVGFLAERAWDRDSPPGWVELDETFDYMSGDRQVPIMTNSESIEQLEANAYGKPLVALNVLREAVLGPQAFDHAFRTYARRWQFKRPYPADFFRTMEDASGVDLDWFWRGWFYTNDHVDISIDGVRRYTLDTRDPAIEKPRAMKERETGKGPRTLFHQPDAARPARVDADRELRDFYDDFDEATVLPSEREEFEELLAELRAEDIDPALLRTERYFYAVELKNIGGLVMPLHLHIGYADGSTEELRVPAEIWRRDAQNITKLLLTKKEITSLELDPDDRTADADRHNNLWPRRVEERRFQLFKEPKKPNPMQELKERRP